MFCTPLHVSDWIAGRGTDFSFGIEFSIAGPSGQKNSRRLELSISKNTLHGRWGGSRQCRPKVPSRFAFPAARNPRIWWPFVIREKFSSNFPGTFSEFSSGTPETATAFSSFQKRAEYGFGEYGFKHRTQ